MQGSRLAVPTGKQCLFVSNDFYHNHNSLMRALFFVAVFCYTLVSSCYTNKINEDALGDHYKYTFELENEHSSHMDFEDSTIRVSFDITDKSIHFILNNKARESIKINWNDATIALTEKPSPVIHNGIKYNNRFDSMRPTILAAGDTIRESVIPAFKVYQNTTRMQDFYGNHTYAEGPWKVADLLISWDYKDEKARKAIHQMVGSKIELYLPIVDANNKEVGYRFSFKVKGVQCTTCKDEATQPKIN
jgi:hypothetical protein